MTFGDGLSMFYYRIIALQDCDMIQLKPIREVVQCSALPYFVQ
jgi:hypothetical protein